MSWFKKFKGTHLMDGYKEVAKTGRTSTSMGGRNYDELRTVIEVVTAGGYKEWVTEKQLHEIKGGK